MSSYQANGPPTENDGVAPPPPPPIPPAATTGLVPNPAGTEFPDAAAAELLLDAARDVRQIIRLVQCAVCSSILRDAIILPCGNTICKNCVPETRPRQNITWPATEDRSQGFDCPFPDCAKQHAAADCSTDVTLNKVVAIARTAVTLGKASSATSGVSTHITTHDEWSVAGISSLGEKEPESRVLVGGRILATYNLAQMGKLAFNTEVSYTSVGVTEDEVSEMDASVFLELKESVRTEMDCQVCYALFLDPMTTTCGHTYCRTCVHQILNHSNLCPICRRTVSLQSRVDPRSSPSNNRLVSMINGFWADLVAIRAQAYRLEQETNSGDANIPIFELTLSYPSMPLFLHVFEPRYRLMVRRAMEGDRTFGMVARRVVPARGEPNFMRMGTLMRIVNIEFFPDGRSLLETVGISRFKIINHDTLDGYLTAQIEKIDDISIAEEEAIEASELSRRPGSATRLTASQNPSMESLAAARRMSNGSNHPDLDSMSTRELAEFGVAFVRRMQAQSVTWLANRMIAIFGECPEDPATFPWWFGSVLPVSESEKYRLLNTSSVRERLKISCRWAIEWEANTW
ncbi:ATP-dependent protease La domain-containing protein [Xylariaceae sp. FL0255]|nr:ATP-dependent protease La domain-containing protein [Xylariaceae sp. FL0255]